MFVLSEEYSIGYLALNTHQGYLIRFPPGWLIHLQATLLVLRLCIAYPDLFFPELWVNLSCVCCLSFAGLYSQESTTRSPKCLQVVSITDRVLPSDFINFLGEEYDFKCDVSY